MDTGAYMQNQMDDLIESGIQKINELESQATRLLEGKIVNCKNSTTIFDTDNYVKYKDAFELVVELLNKQ